MKHIKSKIILTYILLSLVIVTSVGVVLSMQLEEYFKDRLIRQLSTQSDMVLTSLEQDSTETFGQFYDRMIRLAREGNIRITFIRLDGRVLADSDVDQAALPGVENHANRPEVIEASRQGFGSNTRHSATVGKDLLYVAKKLEKAPRAFVMAGAGFIRLSMHLEDVNQAIRDIRWKILFVGGSVLVLVIIVSSFISRQVSSPIEKVAEQVERIRLGDLDQRIEVRSNDEIRNVARAINELLDKVKSDIVQLKKLEKIRTEFLGNVSHELRTPIFSLQGFLETLLDGAIDDPRVNRVFIEKALSHSRRLNALLGDLIEISRIESGDMKMSFRYFSIAAFLEMILSDMLPLAESKRIRLAFDHPGEDYEVFGDRERLKQVLVNLIDNAIKYNTVDGSVVLTYAKTPAGFVRVSVTDTGLGIREEDLPRIFERFYRVDRERSREAGGTGLGLAIVKHIVEAHGSSMRVTSAFGKGSSFSFDLKTT
jgi:two-component system, OmpR family, phosphate regulon sensor histidine kinase PhoR